jgi:phytol kinase
MDQETQGLVVTLAYLFGVLIFAKALMLLFPSLSLEFIRKTIHILVTNWWFIMTHYSTTTWGALFGPTFFIIFNAIATAYDLWRFVGMSDRKRNLGLVYYPLSLFFIVLLSQLSIIPRYCAGVGFFCMGYGDGFAALVGKAFGRKRINGARTYVGSATMFVISVGVMIGFSVSYDRNWTGSIRGIGVVVAVATAATLLEALTPNGLDNISVPIGTALLLAYLEKLLSL